MNSSDKFKELTKNAQTVLVLSLTPDEAGELLKHAPQGALYFAGLIDKSKLTQIDSWRQMCHAAALAMQRGHERGADVTPS